MDKQDLKNTIKTVKFMFSSVWKKQYGKLYALLKLIIAVTDSIIPIVSAILPGLIIDGLINNQSMKYIFGCIAILCLTPIINELIHLTVYDKITYLRQKLDISFAIEFYRQVAEMDYELNESPEVQTLKDRAQQTLESSVSIVDLLLNFFSALLSLIMIFAVIATMNPLIVLIVIAQIWINTYIAKWLNKKSYETDVATSALARKIYASTCVFDDDDFAKELRLYNLKEHIISSYIRDKNAENKIWQKHRHTQFKGTVYNVLLKNTQLFLVYIYLTYNVIVNALPIGQLTIYLASVNQFSGALERLLSSYIDLTGRSLKIDELIKFINIPIKQHSGKKEPPNITPNTVIEFNNVSFKYPGSDTYALKNFNLKIKASEKLCIVGANGSGKSTFIKLITRLYFPTEGTIMIDGTDINEYDYRKYQDLFAPVFQDFMLFFASLRENVVMAKDEDNKLLDKVYTDSNLKSLISDLKYADNTQVYKWECEDGFEPSGGEGQKIAIARALYHERPIYLLDEPTAALDPNAEYEIYTQFSNMIKDKTAILITHRLSAVQLADKIAVFEDGHVAEYGTHSELYAKGGIYTEMFDKQAQFYRDNPNRGEKTESETVSE